MASWRFTNFTWASDTGEGPREEYAPEAGRVSAPIYLTGATADARGQAAMDLLGANAVRSVTFGGGDVPNRVGAAPEAGPMVVGDPPPTRYYISRLTPYPYPLAKLKGPLSGDLQRFPLYCTSLVGGEGRGVPALNAAGQNDYPQYRWNATWMPRPYRIKEDGDVRAVAGGFSPLYDSGAGIGYPDEGDCLQRGWTNTRYVTRRVSAAGRLITIREGLLRFQTQTAPPLWDPVMVGMPFNEVVLDVEYTWHLVPVNGGLKGGIPWKAITGNLGKVNLGPFDVWSGTTLLLLSADVEIGPGPLGDLLATVTYKMKYAPHWDGIIAKGWNSILRVFPFDGRLGYDNVFSSREALPITFPYPSADLSALFRPDQS